METPYNAIANAGEAQAGKLNIINCNSDELHIELGTVTDEGLEDYFITDSVDVTLCDTYSDKSVIAHIYVWI